MSNIDTVKTLYAAFGRGDVPAILANLTSDLIWESETPSALTFGGIRHGIQEATGFFTALAAEHANPVLNPTDFIASGDSVAVFGRYQATMKATGKRADTPIAHFWTFRDGKVPRYVGFVNAGAFLDALQPAATATAR